ncbi:hypothetical protein BH09MYX1_BH09MYX1_09810 [soil metagenome]
MRTATFTLPALASSAIGAMLVAASFLGADCGHNAPVGYAPTRDLSPDGAVLSLRFGTPKDVAISDELRSVAPQYFNPSSRDAFAVSTNGQPGFYDPLELTVRHAMPQGMYRFWRTLGETFVGYGADGIRVARRNEAWSHPVAQQTPNRGLADGARTRNDDIWLALTDRPVAPTMMGLLLVRGSSGQLFPNPVGPRHRIERGDLAVGALDDDRIALAWVEPTAGGLALMLTFRDPTGTTFTPPIAVDSVPMDGPAAELSGRTGTELTVVGLVDRVAIAWRPLLPDAPVDVGISSAPPQRAVRAELRIVIADGVNAPTLIRHGTWASPLGGTTGIGPWPLATAGLVAARIGETAAFAWNDVSGQGARVLATLAKHGLAPLEVAPLVYRLQFRTTPLGSELLMFAPNGAVLSSSVDYTY